MVDIMYRVAGCALTHPKWVERTRFALFVGVHDASMPYVAAAFLHLPLPVAVVVLVGSFALALLALYPLQLALGGQGWWECVQAAYPQQSVGMVAYIYVPATVTFSSFALFESGE